jgi:glycosyltransferase involved in cell wall biosynthesis
LIKICHIVNLITGKADGVYAHLKSIFRNYDQNKFEHILIFQGGEKIEEEVRELGIKVFISESLKKKISIGAFVDILNVIKSEQVDIVHTHLIKPYAIAGIINIFVRKKLIFNYHGIFLADNPYYNFTERFIYRSFHTLISLFGEVHAVLVPSRRSKELLMNETKLFPEPQIYYNGYSPRQHSPLVDAKIAQRIEELKQQKRIIAVIGRLEVDKRIDRALMLIRNLTDKNIKVHLLVFGDGSLKEQMNQLFQEHQLNKSVDILGYIEDVESYYKYFDMVLFTSDWEGMPLTMWEALANGVPVVAPDVGGFKEILEENNCGMIYKPGNLVQAEEVITKLLTDEESKQKFGKNGKAVVELKYNEKNFIGRLENIYLDLISE